jgi:integrase
MSRATGTAVRQRHAAPAGSVFASEDVCALAALALDPGSTRPRYDDDVWALTGMSDAHNLVTQSQKIWDFTRITNPRWRPVVKDILMALLVPRHPAVLAIPSAPRIPRSPLTCHDYLWGTTAWLNWLTARGLTRLTDVTQADCDAYLHEQSWSLPDHDGQRRPLHPASVSHLVRCVQAIANYGGLLRDERYRPGFYPWQARSANLVSGLRVTRGVNHTQPVRDELLRPLLAGCLYLVDTIGPHLADLHDQIRAEAETHRQLPSQNSRDAAAKMHQHLHRLIRDNEPLPQLRQAQVAQRLKAGWAPADPLLRVNLDRMLRQAGICKDRASLYLPQLRDPLTDAVARLGVAPPLARRAAQVPAADTGQLIAWTEPLHDYDLLALTQHVTTACLILTAAVTGMRRSELGELATGCRLPATDVPGGGRRYRLASRLIKGQPFGGVADEWVVLPEVDRAVHLAERLANTEPGRPLFGTVEVGQRYHYFRDWLARPFATRLGLTPPPTGPLTAAMLRRTLALELARRPGGLLAARIHLRHVSVVTTEGYAHQPGGAQALFHAETQQLQAEHHLELTVQAFRDYHNGVMPTGPGARDLINTFQHVDAELAPANANVLDTDRRMADLLRRQAGTLHLAPANYCWFRDPAKALCLKLAGTPNATSPLAAMCDSARCPQATHHAQHRPVWAQAVQTHTVFLGTIGRGRAAERQRLQAELDRAQHVVDAIDAANRSCAKATE